MKSILILVLFDLILKAVATPANTVYPYSNKKSWTIKPFEAGDTIKTIYDKLYGVAETGDLKTARKVVPNPYGDGHVLQITYGKGGYGSKGPGGHSMYLKPPIDWNNAKTVRFCYDVAVDADFNFGKKHDKNVQDFGLGKFPGLFSGPRSNCEDPASGCFSMRYMFRALGQGQNADGEIFPTVIKESDWSKVRGGWCPDRKKCGNGAGGQGDSIGRGSFQFVRGKWQTLCQVITATSSGKIVVYYNGKNVIEKTGVKFYTGWAQGGIQFATFFGGNQDNASPKEQRSYFKNLSLTIIESGSGAPGSTSGVTGSASTSQTGSSQKPVQLSKSELKKLQREERRKKKKN